MRIDDSILAPEERIALALRALYGENGYRPFKMSKFEEYELYMRHKEFLPSEGVITFTDTNGRLMALKPDVTLSIIKNAKDVPGTLQKVFYSESVYRISGSVHTYQEITQTGLECIGEVGQSEIAEILRLAVESAELISPGRRIVVSHMGFVERYLADYGIDLTGDRAIWEALNCKNGDTLKKLCSQTQYRALLPLLQSYPEGEAALEAVAPLCRSPEAKRILSEFAALWRESFPADADFASVDFSLANSTGYYSGIIFKCYISGIAAPVISGGQYDGLMRRLGRTSHAIGFAVYLDELDGMNNGQGYSDGGFLNIALPKGRLGEKAYAMFERAGYDCPEIRAENRKLVFENREKGLRFFWVKPSDVAIYVERGAADVGVAGYDILLEYAPEVYDLCDLKMGRCRMAVAAKADFVEDESKTLRVATKFSNIARRYYGEQCREIDMIHLNGSIELAPILGLSDVIVDIVETGKTLRENQLEVRETIVAISAHLIANRSAYQFKKNRVEALRSALAKQVKQDD